MLKSLQNQMSQCQSDGASTTTTSVQTHFNQSSISKNSSISEGYTNNSSAVNKSQTLQHQTISPKLLSSSTISLSGPVTDL